MKTIEYPKVSGKLCVERVEVGGQEIFLVLDPQRPSWAFINKDGLRLLNLFTGERTPIEISQEVERKYGLDFSRALQIVESFIQDMVKARVLCDEINEKRSPEFSLEGLTIEITKECNLNCVHCYLSAGTPLENELSLRELKRLLESASELGARFISISGGEPLLRPDCLEILEYSTSLGLQTTVGTNGTIINSQLAKSLSKIPITIQVSLDGATRDVNEAIRGKRSYDAVIEGLNNLIACGIQDRIILSFTPMRPNIKEAPALIDLALEMEIPAIQFNTLFPAGNAREHWEELNPPELDKLWLWDLIRRKSEELRERQVLINECLSINIDELRVSQIACGIGKYLRIDPQGNIYPCQGFIKDSEFCLGNLRMHTLEEVVHGGKLEKIWKSNLKRPSMIENCRTCSWRGLCGSGCMASAYEINRTIWSPDSCRVRKQWIKKQFESKLIKHGKSL